MTFDDFIDHIKQRSIYEAIYVDSEQRTILVIQLLELYSSVRGLIAAEREACALIAESQRKNTEMLTSHPPQSGAARNIEVAIRARGGK